MPGLRKLSMFALLIGTGYLCGMAHILVSTAGAQPGADISDAAGDKVRAANTALRSALQSLESEGAYNSVMLVPNSYLILSGGGDAQADLDSGNGVDPETFAALYAAMSITGEDGLIDPLIKESLSMSNGQVTYNGEVVMLYSRERLRQYFAERLRYSETQL